MIVMSTRVGRFLVLLAAVFVAISATQAAGETVHYVLAPESQILQLCSQCTTPPPPPEPLEGSFDLTTMPVPSDYAVDAVTQIDWHSDSFSLRGSGFIQHLGTDQVAMVVDTRVNQSSALLTTEHRQHIPAGNLRLVLVTPRGADTAYVVTLVAVPVVTEGPDQDADGIRDRVDNCRTTANASQGDLDGDAIGDACDTCAETPPNSIVVENGCAPSQMCPCDGPAPGEEWPNQRAYVQCVSRVLKSLQRQNKMGRREVLDGIQGAVRSGCGRRVLALL